MQILKVVFKQELNGHSYLKKDEDIYRWLEKEGWERREILERVSEKLPIDYHHGGIEAIDLTLLENFDEDLLRVKKALPYKKESGVYHFIANDMSTRYAQAIMNQSNEKGVGTLSYFMMDFEMEALIKKAYQSFRKRETEREENDLLTNESEEGLEENRDDEKEASGQKNEKGVVEAVNGIIKKALTYRASDIHVEPVKADLIVRYRVHGKLSLRESMALKKEDIGALINRFKIMAGLDIGERKKAQDGRITDIKYKEAFYDFRVSTVTTVYGQKMVMRVFKKTQSIPTLQTLGFQDETTKRIIRDVKRKSGLILITGATGSGKTTTLHSMISELDRDEYNIYTIEDPVETIIPKINQIDVKETGIDFSDHLEALMRQDPDVIVIGEIRNEKTARLAIQASLSGHLVLATFHTNGVTETIDRLIQLNLKPYQIASSLIGIGSQSLVRRLCEGCKVHQPLSETENRYLKGIKDQFEGKFHEQFQSVKEGTYHEKGCSSCNGIGFLERIALTEYHSFDEKEKFAITDGNYNKIVKESNTFKPKVIDGLDKVIKGETTLRELMTIT